MLPIGTIVRFVDNRRTRRAGVVGVQSAVVKVDRKGYYRLENGFRAHPSFVEPTERWQA